MATATGSTTWRVTCMSGAGIGMMTAGRATQVPRPQTRAELTLAQTGRACCGATRGGSPLPSCAAPIAASSIRRSNSALSDFGLFWPQVSELNGRAEQSGRSEGRAETDCGEATVRRMFTGTQ